VLIHPGASREFKRWPTENWARLADAVIRHTGVEIVLTGDRAETTLAEEVARRMKSPAEVVAGKWTLPILARSQAAAAAFLSGDTGPYHLAVAMGCPTVTLFAPTDRGSSVEACGPHAVDSTRHRAIQTDQFGESIATLSFERVWEEVTILLDATCP
jgi:ADP-heptose:LPS heptosyltransferase